MEPLDVAAVQLKPRDHHQIESIHGIVEADVGTHDGVSAAVVKKHLHYTIGNGSRSARLSPDGALTIDGGKQRNRRSSEGTGSRTSHVPEGTDLSDEGIRNASELTS